MATTRTTAIRALALALLLAACTGDGGEGDGEVVVVDGQTVAVDPSAAPGWLGETGATGATGETDGTAAPAPVVQGTFRVTFPAGTAVIAISGYSCDVAAGEWSATVSVSEGGDGSTSFDFAMPAGTETANADWELQGTWEGSAATYTNDGTVHKGGPPDRPRLQFFGLLEVARGAEVIRGPANGATTVELGVVDQCSS